MKLFAFVISAIIFISFNLKAAESGQESTIAKSQNNQVDPSVYDVDGDQDEAPTKVTKRRPNNVDLPYPSDELEKADNFHPSKDESMPVDKE